MRFFIFLPLILAIWLICLSSTTKADCCKPTKIRFELAANNGTHTCETYGGKPGKNYTCKAKICNDGNNVRGTWCGKGRCNPSGCHCKKGCLASGASAIDSFREKHGFFNFIYVGHN
ncbi:GL13593 [Drosophila persimilis]|uniref:GL13593 n=1 Tax=Drosophila persimilis TaxID=7234 RepID=B4GPJ5_DROPE|nr:GL13593 [Drosophila persimilis]